MGTLKQYNSVPLKDNCALFSPTPYFWGRQSNHHHHHQARARAGA